VFFVAYIYDVFLAFAILFSTSLMSVAYRAQRNLCSDLWSTYVEFPTPQMQGKFKVNGLINFYHRNHIIAGQPVVTSAKTKPMHRKS
jgi:hypothetical protein